MELVFINRTSKYQRNPRLSPEAPKHLEIENITKNHERNLKMSNQKGYRKQLNYGPGNKKKLSRRESDQVYCMLLLSPRKWRQDCNLVWDC